MQSKNTAIIMLVVAALGLVALFMFRNNRTVEVPAPMTDTETMAPESTTPSETKATTEPASTESTIKTFEIHAGMPYFTPNTIQVNKGDTVKIKLINDGGMHDFVLDEFSVESAILTKTDETDEFEFVADQAGTFEYYCSIMNHRAMGMVGTLVVVDAEAQ